MPQILSFSPKLYKLQTPLLAFKAFCDLTSTDLTAFFTIMSQNEPHASIQITQLLAIPHLRHGFPTFFFFLTLLEYS